MSITLTGSEFTSDYYPSGMPDLSVSVALVDVPGDAAGVTVENLVIVNSTTVTCDLVISQTAASGGRYVMVSHTGGNSNSLVFMVGFPSDFLVFFG